MNRETWLPVVGYKGIYEVSDFGRIKSLARLVERSDGHPRRQPERPLSQWKSAVGEYRLVTLSKNGQSKSARVHRLVLTAFVGQPGEDQEACHKNGDPSDNRLDNLRWGSRSDNTLDQVAHGTHNNVSKTHCPSGHVLAGENLLPSAGYRKCRLCCREAVRRYKARRRLELSGAAS